MVETFEDVRPLSRVLFRTKAVSSGDGWTIGGEKERTSRARHSGPTLRPARTRPCSRRALPHDGTSGLPLLY